MKLEEKQLEKNIIYNGRVINVGVDSVELPDGKKSKREYVEHPGGVAILAIKDGYIYLVNQFRYPYRKTLLEIPAGKLDKGEEPEHAAIREFNEELGAKTNSLRYLGQMYPSCGYTNEIIHLYTADEFEFENQHLDEGEFLNVVKMDFNEFEEKIRTNEIKDAKTIIAYSLYKNR